ncbi:hypothetical protein LC76P1_00230 [Lysinibacillus phage LC76P1]|nr:hypothetical protein LC76P1_00230 [Lysinibacillus phage LC76P1]
MSIKKANEIRGMKVSELHKEIRGIKARTGTSYFKGSSKFLKSELVQILIDWYETEAVLQGFKKEVEEELAKNNEIVADKLEEGITIHNVVPTLKKLLDGGKENSEKIRALMAEIQAQTDKAIKSKNRRLISAWSTKTNIVRCLVARKLGAIS